MGFLKNGTFSILDRNSLIGGYLGQTAIKTLKVLSLYGNPISLIKNYKSLFIGEFKFLKYFDDEKIDWEGI